MNALAMLERCGQHQPQEYDATLPATYLPPPQPWREQDTLAEPYVMGCED